MSYREWGNIVFLSHFDYPYYGEPNTGLRDEVTNSNTLWKTIGDVTFAGHEFPVEEELTDTSIPKWGYRCVHLTSSAKLELTTGYVINAIKSQRGELSLMLRMNTTGTGPILELKSADDTVITSINNSSGSLNINGETQKWLYILLRFEDKLKLYADGALKGEIAYPANYSQVAKISLGGSDIYVDEFRVSDSLGTLSVPAEPYHARINLNRLGGFGDGHNGNFTIATTNIQLNSYAQVTGIMLGTRLTIANTAWGKYGMPVAGDEIMIHVVEATAFKWEDLGKYEFAKIRSITTTQIEIESSLTELNVENLLREYKVQAISVPNIKSLSIERNSSIIPAAYANGRGGLVVMRILNKFKLYGSIYTTGFGPLRTDYYQMTHGELIDRIILNNGGGAMIFSAVQPELIDTNLAGATHSSIGGARDLANKGLGYGGGAHHGGVGGGGGWNIDTGAAPGHTGGYCAYCGVSGASQGVEAGGNTTHQHAGAGAGGYVSGGPASGANVIFITNKTNWVDGAIEKVIQAGGNSSGYGSSGTGFCYIGEAQ